MASLVLMPMIPYLDFISNIIAVSTFTRNVTLIKQREFSVGTNHVIYHIEDKTLANPVLPFPLKEDILCKNNPFFSSANSSLPYPSSYKNFPFCAAPQRPF